MGVHSWTSRRPPFGALRAKPRTRSVLAVPPDSDGLLHPWLRRSVAPCIRSWGSPCFDLRWRQVLKPIARRLQSSPLRRIPFEAFPSPAAGIVSPRTLPSHRWFQPPRQVLPFLGELTRYRVSPSISRSSSTGEAGANAPPLPVECCPLLPWASRFGVCPARPVARGATGIRCSTRLQQGLSPSPEGQAPWANSHRRRWC